MFIINKLEQIHVTHLLPVVNVLNNLIVDGVGKIISVLAGIKKVNINLFFKNLSIKYNNKYFMIKNRSSA
jgi:hypothetical protein